MSVAEIASFLVGPPWKVDPRTVPFITMRALREWFFVKRNESGRPESFERTDGDEFGMFAQTWKKRARELGLELTEEQCQQLFVWHMRNENENKGDPERWRTIVEWLIPGFKEAAANHANG